MTLTNTEGYALRGFTIYDPAKFAEKGRGLMYVDPGDRFQVGWLSDKVAALMVERGDFEYARPTP